MTGACPCCTVTVSTESGVLKTERLLRVRVSNENSAALRLTPAQMRRLAAMLLRAAEKIEGKTKRRRSAKDKRQAAKDLAADAFGGADD